MEIQMAARKLGRPNARTLSVGHPAMLEDLMSSPLFMKPVWSYIEQFKREDEWK
jgi:hypothetical protein